MYNSICMNLDLGTYTAFLTNIYMLSYIKQSNIIITLSSFTQG